MKEQSSTEYGDAIQWPNWVGYTGLFLLVVLICMHVLDSGLKKHKDTMQSEIHNTKEFYMLQQQYLSVYYLIMFADWLQGPNMYTLYQVCICCIIYSILFKANVA